MDKVLAILKEKANLSDEDLNTIKETFETAVKARVDEETKVVNGKADEYCRQKIDSAVALKTQQLETLAEQFCEKKAATIARKADKKIAEQTKKLETLTQQYINEFFEEKFKERYGEELQAIEDRVVEGVDVYFNYAVNEKINPELITKTAINETFAPIVQGIRSLFEEQYVPLNVSGTKKLKEANRKIAELESKLKEQYNENIRISEAAEQSAKKTLIAEKTEGFTAEQKEKVNEFFQGKSFSSVKEDIDNYCSIITETALPIVKAATLNEARQQALRKTPSIEDATPDFVSEKFKPVNEDVDSFLTKANEYLLS
jgi:exonuclease VII large subunit